MSKFADIPITTSPEVSNRQWRAQQVLEQIYPTNRTFKLHAQVPLNPGTPIHKADEAVGVDVPVKSSIAVPAKPTPIHRHTPWYCYVGAAALWVGILLAVADFYLKRRFADKKIVLSGYSHALPVVDSTTPYPWEIK